MTKAIALAGVLTMLLGSAAMAACPTSVPGDTREAIRANERRVLCLQQEIQQDTRMRKLESDIRANERAIQSLQMQRRFDNLPRVPAPSPFTHPQPFVRN